MRRASILGRLGAGLAACALVVMVSGCAHPISLAGDVSGLAGTGRGKVDRAVGLLITEEDRKREFISPGGGGDKLSYFPYRDLETGLYVALAESSSRVVRVSGKDDPKVKAEGLSYLIVPTVTTTSHSESIVTWPPTLFVIDLTSQVQDMAGQALTEVRVAGDGRAEYDEFKKDFSLAAKRAADDLLKKLIVAMGEALAKLK